MRTSTGSSTWHAALPALAALGVDRYVILVQGKGSPDGDYLFDLK